MCPLDNTRHWLTYSDKWLFTFQTNNSNNHPYIYDSQEEAMFNTRYLASYICDSSIWNNIETKWNPIIWIKPACPQTENSEIMACTSYDVWTLMAMFYCLWWEFHLKVQVQVGMTKSQLVDYTRRGGGAVRMPSRVLWDEYVQIGRYREDSKWAG